MTGRRVVEVSAARARPRRLRDEAREPITGVVERAEEVRVDRRVAGDELRRVEIPTLVDAERERVLDVAKRALPTAPHRGPVLVLFARRWARPAVGRDRELRRRPVGNLDSRPRDRELHQDAREVARRVPERVARCDDVEARGEIVRTEMERGAAPAPRFDERGERDAAVFAEERRRRLDHRFDADRAERESERSLELVEEARERGDLARVNDLRERDREPRREAAARARRGGDDEIERARGAGARRGGERFDSYADERRERARGETFGELAPDRLCMRVFLVVRPRAVAVLEVDSVVLDRLPAELLGDALAHGLRERGGLRRRRAHLVTGELERAGERDRVGRVTIERRERDAPELFGGVVTEEMRAAIHRVDRLPRRTRAELVPARQIGERARDRGGGEDGGHHGGGYANSVRRRARECASSIARTPCPRAAVVYAPPSRLGPRAPFFDPGRRRGDPMSETAKLSYGEQTLEMKVIEGTEGEKGIDIGALRGKTGLITQDPGFMNTGSCQSAITFIDGDKGILRYRGYSIEELAEKSSFLEVSYLLLEGRLPTKAELDAFTTKVGVHTMLHEDVKRFYSGFPKNAHPMAVCAAVSGALSTFYQDSLDIQDEEQVDISTVRLLAKFPTMAACSYKHSIGQPFIYPSNALPYTTNFLRMMFATPCEDYPVNPVIAKALDLLLVLHADHEQNCSTSTVRLVGSSQANLFASISAGVNALWGPLHGGANQAVIEMLNSIEKEGISGKTFLERAKNKNDTTRLMGFGHRVYKNFDPRARIIKKACADVLGQLHTGSKLLDIAIELEEMALKDDYFISRKLYPNVDFYSGIIYQAIGIPVNMFTVLFAMGRLPGWISHWKEMHKDPATKIGRPRQIYTGATQRPYTPIDSRSLAHEQRKRRPAFAAREAGRSLFRAHSGAGSAASSRAASRGVCCRTSLFTRPSRTVTTREAQAAMSCSWVTMMIVIFASRLSA